MRFRLSFEESSRSSALDSARVPWDSELLGVSVVELRLRESEPGAGKAIEEWLAADAPRPPFLLVLRTDPAAVALAETLSRLAFYPVELSYELSIPLRRLGAVAPGGRPRGRLRRATPDDLADLRTIAGSAFRADRFHLDPHIPDSAADARFSSWVTDGVKAGEPIYVYENDRTSEVLGFFHLRESGPQAIDISLAAVHPRLNGTGLGAAMYEAALLESRALGYETATTRISASNLDVVNLFARLGFSFTRARLTWHFWRSS